MIILGNSNIPYQKIEYISTQEEIVNTKPNSVVAFDYNIDLIKYCFEQNIKSMVKISSIKEGIYCNSLGVYYIVVDDEIAKNMQQIAQNYMFDSKIIQEIQSDDEIEQIAKNNIDGVIFK